MFEYNEYTAWYSFPLGNILFVRIPVREQCDGHYRICEPPRRTKGSPRSESASRRKGVSKEHERGTNECDANYEEVPAAKACVRVEARTEQGLA